ncbi:MAG: hypothetical protein H6Q42_1943 [Deltaproteobacteria bacterium]|jgi:hypothetical protein|nr:hypothetical protein [Deltaproteobacteria bacterium]
MNRPYKYYFLRALPRETRDRGELPFAPTTETIVPVTFYEMIRYLSVQHFSEIGPILRSDREIHKRKAYLFHGERGI